MPHPGIIILLICLFPLLVLAAEHAARRWWLPAPAWLLLVGLLTLVSHADEPKSEVIREEFTNLDAWKPLIFPKIERHSSYSIVKKDGASVLKTEADASASGLVSKTAFDPYRTPVLRWRWRVENVLKKGNAERKDGDDYPLRVYVVFEYDPARASLGMRAKYAMARRIHGEYPPHAALNYIWANRRHDKRILPSPYTKRSQLIILRAGRAKTGEWLEQEVNILEDYKAAFGEKPPRKAYLAVMSDTDNTGEKATGFIDDIELAPKSPKPAPALTTEHRPLNTDHRPPNTEHRTPTTEPRPPNPERRTLNAEH